MPNDVYWLCGGRGQVTGPGDRRRGCWRGRRGMSIKGKVRKGSLTESRKEPVTQERAAE